MLVALHASPALAGEVAISVVVEEVVAEMADVEDAEEVMNVGVAVLLELLDAGGAASLM